MLIIWSGSKHFQTTLKYIVFYGNIQMHLETNLLKTGLSWQILKN